MSPESDPLSWLDLPPARRITPALEATFAAVRGRMGYLRNDLIALAHRPEHVVARQAYSDAIMLDPEGQLAPRERELIALVVSAENRCEVCVLGHAAQLRKLTADPFLVAQIEVNYRHAPLSPRERALADYALKITRAPAEIEPADLVPLREAGLGELAILEAAEIAAYFNMSNRIMSALGIRPNVESYAAYRNGSEG